MHQLNAVKAALRWVYDPGARGSRDGRHRVCAGSGRGGSDSGAGRAIRELQSVTAADDVTRPYDVIVRVEAATLDDLGTQVVSHLQTVGGITHTFTCLIVNL